MAKLPFLRLFKPKIDIESIIRPHLRGLYQSAYRWTLNRQDAEDLVQDVVETVIPRVAELAKVEQPRSWLTKIMYRRFVDMYRRRLANPVVAGYSLEEEGRGALDASSSERDSPDAQLELARVHQRVSAALMQLDEEHRVTLMMFEVEGYSIKEIAATLDIPEGTVKSRLNRARAKMKNALTDGTFYNTYTCVSVGAK
jgi:RNA polymerase sigma-70 factor (ECF subfamily)